MKENDFLEIIKSTIPSSTSYIGDDTAFIEDKDLVLTQDTLVEDVHFRRSTISPYDLGIKSVAVNLSDIAAAGGIAKYILVSLSLPDDINTNFIREFYRGINKICSDYGVLTVGGDITGGQKIYISITAVGNCAGVKPASRSFAKPGDVVIVTGKHGSSRAGLWLLEENSNIVPKNIKDKFIKAHINPVPKLEIGRKILEFFKTPTAMMDTSDGLADALWQISNLSKVCMEIDFHSIPFDRDLEFVANLAKTTLLDLIFYGGEDYELVACVSEVCYKKLLGKNISVFKIGKVIEKEGDTEVRVKTDEKMIVISRESLDSKGFDHFKKMEEE